MSTIYSETTSESDKFNTISQIPDASYEPDFNHVVLLRNKLINYNLFELIPL